MHQNISSPNLLRKQYTDHVTKDRGMFPSPPNQLKRNSSVQMQSKLRYVRSLQKLQRPRHRLSQPPNVGLRSVVKGSTEKLTHGSSDFQLHRLTQALRLPSLALTGTSPRYRLITKAFRGLLSSRGTVPSSEAFPLCRSPP